MGNKSVNSKVSCRAYAAFLMLFFLIVVDAAAQENWSLSVEFSKTDKWLSRINYKEKLRDSADALSELNAIILTLQKKSFFEASIDSVNYDGKKVKAYIFVGEELNWARLDKGNIEEEVLSKTGYRDKIYNQYRFRYKQFGRFVEGILGYYEDNGYPFVSLRLDNIRNIDKSGIDAVLRLDKNKYVEIDSIEIHGGYHVSEKYLYNYLGIKPHKAYNESNVQLISPRIDDLTFIAEQQSPRVVFTETKTTLQLFLKKKRASRFDGVIGLLQDEETGEVQFTGDVKLGLTNAFKRGEVIGLNWRGLPNNTQDLNLKFAYPYLLNTPFGIDADFRLYKRDSTFLDIIMTFGIQYFMNARDFLKVLYQNHTSNLLSTSQYENSSTLPNYLDFKTDYYGAELNVNKLDYLLNPTRGFQLDLSGKAGFKRIKKNVNLQDSLYNDVELKSVIFKGQVTASYFLPLARRHVVLFKNQSSYLDNPQILENELYRIGGLKTLRGFNEESIFVSLYVINTFEYRFILDKTSNLNVFADLAYTEKETLGLETVIDRPYGFGVGTSFETGAGIFSLSYAVGSQKGNAIDIRGAKIHFGFLNYF